MSYECAEFLALGIPAAILHELAHLLMARAMGIRVKRFGLSWKGPYIVREQGPPLANFCTALAGPAMNLALGFAVFSVAPHFGLVNIVLGAYNLLPFVPGLDGHNAMLAYRKLGVFRQAALARVRVVN